jgi:hypothetical protein
MDKEVLRKVVVSIFSMFRIQPARSRHTYRNCWAYHQKRHSINAHFRDFMTKSLVLTLRPVKEGRVHVEDFRAIWLKPKQKAGPSLQDLMVFRTNEGDDPRKNISVERTGRISKQPSA